ncbi:MAG: hypothetical protein WBC13_01070, partial [Dokdonella sp.]
MTNRPETPDILGNIMAGPPAPALVALAAIVNDGGTQMRAGMNADTVREYEDALTEAEAWPFPPVVVFHDGARYWLADGFHRLNAAHRSGKFQEIPAEIKAGTRRDAVLYAAGANASHGLRRTNDDKNRAVKALLEDEEWAKWSDREIARRCAVDNSFVSRLRAKLTVDHPQSDIRSGADGRTINTANIGANRPAQPTMLAVWELEATVRGVYSQVYGGNPEPYATRDMRTGAQMRAGRFWLLCTQSLPANQFRLSDLSQAINNVAAQVEAQRNGTNAQPNPILKDLSQPRTAPPASYTVPEAVEDKPIPDWAAEEDDQLEPEQPAAPVGKLLVDYTEEDWAAAAAAEKQRIAEAVQQDSWRAATAMPPLAPIELPPHADAETRVRFTRANRMSANDLVQKHNYGFGHNPRPPYGDGQVTADCGDPEAKVRRRLGEFATADDAYKAARRDLQERIVAAVPLQPEPVAVSTATPSRHPQHDDLFECTELFKLAMKELHKWATMTGL